MAPLYEAEGVGFVGGREREAVSFKVRTYKGRIHPWVASCKVPYKDGISLGANVAGLGDTEEEALRNLPERHPKYKIKVGKKVPILLY